MDRSGATSRYRRKLTGSRRDRTPHNVPSNRYRIPMDTLALRLAAADGSVDGIPVRRLVAAGFTLLQRSAPLVKALGARRSGVWLRPSPAWVVALAASDGRGAVLLDTEARGEMGPAMLERLHIGALFVDAATDGLVPNGFLAAQLDGVPTTAQVGPTTIDLGSHFGLLLEGRTDATGRDEECLVRAADGATFTHRVLLQQADHDWPILRDFLVPLLRGEHLTTGPATS
jgi:hypothetical protein